MRRERLRPAWSQAELDSLYSEVHAHEEWIDHRMRVPVTAEVASWMVRQYAYATAADLSCGDGYMLDAVRGIDDGDKVYGDLVIDPYSGMMQGSIEQTIKDINPVDLLLCAETLEHLDDPDAVLVDMRDKTRGLVLSTPVGSWGDDTPGHYWAWDREAVEDMMAKAGFSVVTYLEMEWTYPGLFHKFGVWGCI